MKPLREKSRENKMEFWQRFGSLFASMYYLGQLFDFRPDGSRQQENGGSTRDVLKPNNTDPKRATRRRVAHGVYCIGTCVLLWLRVLAYIPSFWVGTSDFSSDDIYVRVVAFGWMLQCALNLTVTLHGSSRDNTFAKFSELWACFCNDDVNINSSAAPGVEASVEPEDDVYADITVCYPTTCEKGELRQGPNLGRLGVKHSGDASKDPPPQLSQDTEAADDEAMSRLEKNDVALHPGIRGNQVTTAHSATESLAEEELTPLPEGHNTRLIRVEPSISAANSPAVVVAPAVVAPSDSVADRGLALPSTPADPRGDCDYTVPGNSASREAEARRGKHRPDLPDPDRGDPQTTAVWYAALAWLITFVNAATLAALLFADTQLGMEWMVPILTAPFGTSLPARAAVLPLYVAFSASFVFPGFLFCALSCAVAGRFRAVLGDLTARLSRCGRRFPCGLERERQRHLRLCQAVRLLDGTLGKLVLLSYAINLPLSVLMLSLLVDTTSHADTTSGTLNTTSYATTTAVAAAGVDDATAKVTYGLWLVCNLGYLLLISLMAVVVNEAAHSPQDRLYFVRADKATAQQLTHLQLFLCKVSGNAIGFTALGIFAVTKETILTLGGLLVTYVVVILQFKSA